MAKSRKKAPDLKLQTRERLEFPTVLEFFALAAQTVEGKRKILAMDLMPASEQKNHFDELNAWLDWYKCDGRLRFPTIPGPELFERNPHTKPFFKDELRQFARVLSFWAQLLERKDLAFTLADWQLENEIIELGNRLNNLFDQDGDWREDISPNYQKLIREWVATDHRLDQLMSSLSRRYSDYLNESMIFERNHRRVLAVAVNFRGRVKGIVHDYSGSGQTIFVEPEETVSVQNKIIQLESEIEEELWRIRVALSRSILEHKTIQKDLCPKLAGMDQMHALAKTAADASCQILCPNDERRLLLSNARHPFLDAAFAKHRMEVLELDEMDRNKMVPFTLFLEDDLYGLVISGANTGGKTVTLKTTGLLAWMANSGLPIGIDEGSSIPYYASILADIGDNQSLSHNLSTFASHLANMRQVLEQDQSETLVLLDELGSGTDPMEGNALARALIEEIIARDFHLLITTHQQVLCTLALNHPRLDNGSMIFDPKRLLPTYRFTQGVPGRSHALDIASSAGVPKHVLEAARNLIDDDQIDIQAAIRQLQLQHKELSKQKQKMRREELRLFRRMKESREEAEKLKQLQEEAKRKSRQRLTREVEKAESELRGLLRDVTNRKLARNALTELATKRKEILEPYGEPEKLEEVPIEASGLAPTDWQVGDKVYVKTFRREGILESIDRKKARVDCKGMVLTVDIRDLLHLNPPELEPVGKVTDIRENEDEVSVELKLLGFRVEDALLELDRTIDRALSRQLPFLKVIHGHGSGALKVAVRDFLRKHVAKKSFEVKVDRKNDGITELHFN